MARKARHEERMPEPGHCRSAITWLDNRGWDLAPLTGQDYPALEAVAHCWKLIGHSDIDGRAAAIWAIASLVDGMQPVAWPMARELCSHALDWGHREEFWPLVVSAYRRRKEGFTPGPDLDELCERLRNCHKGHPAVMGEEPQ